jgi:hypothetical protein
MTVCVGWLQTQIPESPGYVAATLELLALASVGLAAYVGTIALSWQLTGRPAGAEVTVIEFLKARFGR